MIINFNDFIDESYLDSNYAPLYHFTTMWSLKDIFKSNSLLLGYYDHIINGKKTRILSLTRSRLFKMNKDLEVKICLDKDRLINNYKINPCDFFLLKMIKRNGNWIE